MKTKKEQLKKRTGQFRRTKPMSTGMTNEQARRAFWSTLERGDVIHKSF